MSPVAILLKAASLAALLVCNADSLEQDRENRAKVSPAKTIPVHCRMYFGCTPIAKTPAGQVHQ